MKIPPLECPECHSIIKDRFLLYCPSCGFPTHEQYEGIKRRQPVRMTKKRQVLLDRIKTEAGEAGVEVDWGDLNVAPLPTLQLVSIRLQLASNK